MHTENMNSLSVREQVLEALRHEEAEDGLYFRNFCHLHEVDERKPVVASERELMQALEDLVREGKVKVDESGEEPVFLLTA